MLMLRGVPIALATDPIFAAIKAHQAAWDLAREASDDEIDTLMAAEADRLAELLRMTPTTIAGCVAMMRWIETYTRDDANHSHLFAVYNARRCFRSSDCPKALCTSAAS